MDKDRLDCTYSPSYDQKLFDKCIELGLNEAMAVTVARVLTMVGFKNDNITGHLTDEDGILNFNDGKTVGFAQRDKEERNLNYDINTHFKVKNDEEKFAYEAKNGFFTYVKLVQNVEGLEDGLYVLGSKIANDSSQAVSYLTYYGTEELEKINQTIGLNTVFDSPLGLEKALLEKEIYPTKGNNLKNMGQTYGVHNKNSAIIVSQMFVDNLNGLGEMLFEDEMKR